MRTTRIVLYGGTTEYAVSVPDLATFLKDTFGIPAQICPSPLLQMSAMAVGRLKSCRVTNLYRDHTQGTTADTSKRNTDDIILYDGHCMICALCGMLYDHHGVFHIVLTDLLLGTYDYDDLRYHGRALVAANPSIVSLPGIVHAPARPRDYCVDVMAAARYGNMSDVESRHAGRFLVPTDPRMQDAVKGYALQALFYHETGEAFCTDASCRLYNAHWQEELIYSQSVSPRLCSRHRSVLDDMTSDDTISY